jgi:hypothetical protein
VARLLATLTLPEEEEMESCAGCGLEESASPLSTETLMVPEEEVRTRRSRRVKAPVMGLEEVLRMVRRAVQWGRWIGVLCVVKEVVLMVGELVESEEEEKKSWLELWIARWVVSMLKDVQARSGLRWRVTATLR